MKVPSSDDRFVKVRAYLTDQEFGYEHWRATQFLAPDGARPAVLIVCRDETDRSTVLKALTSE